MGFMRVKQGAPGLCCRVAGLRRLRIASAANAAMLIKSAVALLFFVLRSLFFVGEELRSSLLRKKEGLRRRS